jgi:subtilase family serine protease
MRRRTVRTSIGLLSAGAIGVVVAATLAAGPASSAPAKRVAVPGTAPTWLGTTPAVGTPSPANLLSFSVVLPLRSAQTAEQLARAVSTPTSPQYHRYLTAQQFNTLYAPKSSSVKSVSNYLKSQGLQVDSVAPGNRWINASGTTTAVNKAFGTKMSTYSRGGKKVTAPSQNASVPTSIKAQIVGITGLDSSVRARPTTVRPKAATASAKKAASQCSQYWGQHSQTVPQAYAGKDSYPTYNCGYTPDQIQSAYGIKKSIVKGDDGSGVTVAILDPYVSSTLQADTNKYSDDQDQPTFTSGQFTEKLFKPFNQQDQCGDWSGEQTLDVQAVHGIAPGAKISYFGAKNCGDGLDDAANYIVQHQSANIVSNSYSFIGEDIPASQLKKEHSIYVQAAIEGIGFYFSTGDDGDDIIDGAPQPSANYAATDPFATAVGGTSLAVDAGGNYSFETGWGTALDQVSTDGNTYTEALPGDFWGGAGGGTSTLFDQPAYQKGIVPDAISRQAGDGPMRTTPDVSLDGDPYTGYLVGQTVDGTYSEYSIGGTSLACPLFAGLQAIASQGMDSPIGAANPTLYSLGKKAYRDILPTKEPIAVTNPKGTYLVTFDRDSTLRTTYGYDNVTGLGTPDGQKFLKAEYQVAGWR